MITENLSTLKIHKLTQAQYERERDAGNIEENALYLTPEGMLPDYSSENNGNFLRIVNGIPAWTALNQAEETEF